MIPSKHTLDASISARAASGSSGSPGAEGPRSAGFGETNGETSGETNDLLNDGLPDGAPAAADGLSDAEQLQIHLAAAGAVANSSGVSLDEFMRAAWSAYVDSRPGLREHLADAQLVQQIMELRNQGKVGQA